MVNSIAFRTFVINVAMEGLCEKYGDEVNLDRQNWVILKIQFAILLSFFAPFHKDEGEGL